MTIRDIVREWLVKHGCDGLCNSHVRCHGCVLEDVLTCGHSCSYCVPAKLTTCTDARNCYGIFHLHEHPHGWLVPAKLGGGGKDA